MGNRLSEEERATQFFKDAPFLVARTTFNIVKGIMKNRTEKEPQATAEASAPRKITTRKKKKGSGSATSFPGQDTSVAATGSSGTASA